MALLDISKVTETLVNLIDHSVSSSPAWPSTTTLTVTPEPPDLLTGDHTIGLYLFYLEESEHFKNMPAQGNSSSTVQYAPMGLNLHYQLTAHSDLAGATGTYQEQLMLGLASKALHDVPAIDDSTVVDGTTIMPPSIAGSGNRFRIELTPMAVNDAVNFWTTGSSPLRMASYYQASVVLLEPEPLPTRPGRVLKFGVFTFPGGLPRLTGSYSVLSFTVPGETSVTEVEARPAQVSPRDPSLPPGPPRPESTAIFTGTSLSGAATNLFVRRSSWDQPIQADASWRVSAASTSEGETVSAEVQETVSGQTVVPGIYAATVQVQVQRTLADGTTRDFDHTSNQTPFVIAPRLDSIPAPTAGGLVQVTGFLFQDPDLGTDDVQVYVSDQRLTLTTTTPPPAGEFAIVNPTTLSLRLPSGLTSGDTVPVRVIIAGAESSPQWVQVP